MKQVVLKFVIAKGIVSTIMNKVFKHEYTHVAIAPKLDTQEFYSFTYNGFTKERKRTYIPKKSKDNYAYYIIDISDSSYELLMNKLNHFKDDDSEYRYSHLTLISAFFRIPLKLKNRYTCSYFVAELLKKTDSYHLKKDPSSYLPHHLAKEINKCQKLEYSFK